METIYFKRDKNYKCGFNCMVTDYYRDSECTIFICRDSYIARRKNHIAIINGVKYNAIKAD